MRRAPSLPAPPGVDACRALLAYEGDAREILIGIKYRNDRRAVGWLAGGMAGLLAPGPGCLVTWPPTSGPRRRRRGFDQAELLARAVARRWGLPCRVLLRRVPGPAQTGRSRDERLATVRFSAGRGRLASPVIIVDDVVTTGATLSGAASALRAAGAPWVGAVTAARTP